MVKQIAIYGKGGIGKSTVSSNTSAALGFLGKKVMQIGCDPKKDSVKLLLNGRKIISILEYLQEYGEINDIENVVKSGYKGVKCIESGGPEPGVGCAGRGIILSIETLKKLGAFSWDNDYIIYDVLGDVVCGGFAVPIREGYAEEIYLVVSGEFMSIFAVNNICKCIKKYAMNGSVKLMGLILNSRNISNEEEIVNMFAQKINTKVALKIPRDNRFCKAEIAKKTIIEMYENSDLAKLFINFAKAIGNSENSQNLIPNPLNDDEIYDLYKSILEESNERIKI
ncbi:MAG: AAA family ATPase [Clostridia bacterium]|nr:AAA family ATPase [Clostridia bacterium]